MDKDQEFLRKASQFLDLNKWGDFLLKWVTALETYGTSRDFAYATRYEEGCVEFSGKKFPVVYTIGSNADKRKEFMAKQKHYIPLDGPENYGLRLSLTNCFLCENIVQEIDAQNHPDKIGSNLLYDLGAYSILPNRYPVEFGRSLFITKNHDDPTTRVTPQQDPANKTTIYLPEEGKTRGNIITSDCLDAVIEASDKLHFFALRNHVLDGMSLPEHDHFHMIPEDLPVAPLIGYVVEGKERTEYGANVYTSSNTPFDTIIISEEEGKSLVETATLILEKLEKDGQVFHLAYNTGNLLISPRNKEEINDRRIQVGAGIPIHYLNNQTPEFIDRIKRYVPMNGEFEWDKFIP